MPLGTYITDVWMLPGGSGFGIRKSDGTVVEYTAQEFFEALAEGTALAGLDATADELDTLHSVTAGTVAASKALVVDANKDLASLRNVTVQNLDAGASGTAGSVDVFPATGSKGKLAITVANQTGNTTVTLNANAMGQATQVNIPDPGAAASYVVQSTAAMTLAEADVLTSVTPGTAAASKAVVADASIDVAGLRNVTGTGTVKGAVLEATASLTLGTQKVFFGALATGAAIAAAAGVGNTPEPPVGSLYFNPPAGLTFSHILAGTTGSKWAKVTAVAESD